MIIDESSGTVLVCLLVLGDSVVVLGKSVNTVISEESATLAEFIPEMNGAYCLDGSDFPLVRAPVETTGATNFDVELSVEAVFR